MKKNLFKWLPGYHQTGYSVLTLAWFPDIWLPFDCYIIKYPPGSYIPPHKDEVKHGRHFRLNFILTHPDGGEFVCDDAIYKSKWLNFFRPDLSEHSVTPVIGRTRYVLSFGWLLDHKHD